MSSNCVVHTQMLSNGRSRVWCDPHGPPPTDEEMIQLVEALDVLKKEREIKGQGLNTIFDVVHRLLAHRTPLGKE